MSEKSSCIYFSSSDDLKDTSYTKIGKTENIKDRLDTYKTSFPFYGFIPYIIILCSAINATNIESVLHKELLNENVWHLNKENEEFNGGHEWFINKYTTEEIKEILEKYDYKYTILEDIKLEEFIKEEKRIIRENQKEYFKKLKTFEGIEKEKPKKEYQERQYQGDIINYCYDALIRLHKIYLELATGGGKTYIMFKLFQRIKPDFIVIFSPRKKINSQNTNENYLSIIDEDYEVLNMSDSTEMERETFFKSKNKRIVVCCSQSSKKLYNLILEHKIKNIFVWFDEAHWSFGEWLNKEDDEKVNKYKQEPHRKFWLEDTTQINYRMFVSASPNKDLSKANENIYGELYNSISVKELIKQGWLCSAVSYQFAYPKDKDDVDIINYILNNFKEDNRNWGFSFHSKQINAFNLFYKHFKKYKKNKTETKPYLLIGDDFYNIFKPGFKIEKVFDDKKLKEIFDEKTLKLKTKDLEKLIKELKKKYEEVEKFYNNKNKENTYLYKDIDNYENNKNSIGYVVQKYSMGYDFKGIDYIIIADNKMSYKDIIQCLGRGFRSDTSGDNGKNKDKVLHIHIPVYYETDTKTKNRKYSFREIKKVLIYLIENVGIRFEDLMMQFNKHFKSNFKSGYDNTGQEEMKKQVLKLLYEANIFKKKQLKQVYKLCIENQIDTLEKYNEFVRKNEYLRLEKNIYDYKGFKWKPICDKLDKNYYSSIKECNSSADKINDKLSNELGEEYEYIIEEYNWMKYNTHDPKIPPYNKLEEHYY